MSLSVTIVYLSWLPYGIELHRRFLDSFVSNLPGQPHKLLIVYNGIGINAELDKFRHLSDSIIGYEVEYLTMDNGQDIDAYFNAVNKVDTEFVIFFNSYTRIRRKNWLELYTKAFSQQDVGIVGATASLQSHYSSVFQEHTFAWKFSESLRYNFGKIKLMLKAFCYWRFLFPPFPNFHIRTNAFMVRATTMKNLKRRRISNKFDAYKFESGYHSLTRQVLRNGLKALILDADGNTYDAFSCSKSCTFWSCRQQNLLVSDNQTDLYDLSDDKHKLLLTAKAWGVS